MPDHDELIKALRRQNAEQERRHAELLEALRASQGGRDISNPRELIRKGIAEEEARREAEEDGE